jgi:hypothetical protein
MPILPLDHPVPLLAALGGMLYPGEADESQQRARAFQDRALRHDQH